MIVLCRRELVHIPLQVGEHGIVGRIIVDGGEVFAKAFDEGLRELLRYVQGGIGIDKPPDAAIVEALEEVFPNRVECIAFGCKVLWRALRAGAVVEFSELIVELPRC